MTNEVFSWNNGSLYLSKTYIKKMKNNMRKVPIIQEKADIYHKIEKTEADKILENVDENEVNLVESPVQISEEKVNYEQDNNWLRKIISRIKTLFWIKK